MITYDMPGSNRLCASLHFILRKSQHTDSSLSIFASKGTEKRGDSVRCLWLPSSCLEDAVFKTRCSRGTDSDASLSNPQLI